MYITVNYVITSHTYECINFVAYEVGLISYDTFYHNYVNAPLEYSFELVKTSLCQDLGKECTDELLQAYYANQNWIDQTYGAFRNTIFPFPLPEDRVGINLLDQKRESFINTWLCEGKHEIFLLKCLFET